MTATSSHVESLSPEERVLRHSAWLLLGQVGAALLILAQGLILARALGAERYGIFALVTAYTLAVLQLLDFRVWETLIRFVPRYQARKELAKATATVQVCLLTDLLSGIAALGVVVMTSAGAAKWLLKGPGGGDLFMVFGVIALVNIPYETASALLRVGGRFDVLAAYKVVVAAARVVATVAVWLHGATVLGMLLAHVIGTAVGLPLLLWYGHRVAKHLALPVWRASEIKSLAGEERRILRFMLMTSLTGTSRLITARADNLVLGVLATPAVVGVYDLAKTIVVQLAGLSNSLYTAIFPEVSRLLANRELQKLRNLQRSLSVWTLSGVVPACLLSSLVAPWVIPAVFGVDFRQSAFIFQILVWRFLWMPLVWLPGFLLSLGREATLTLLAWIYAGLFFLLLIVLVPRLGAVGAAIADLAGQLLWCALALLAVRRAWRELK